MPITRPDFWNNCRKQNSSFRSLHHRILKSIRFRLQRPALPCVPYQKGAVLCDEAGMGKSHEAMLVINQKWLEGYSRILLVIPNADLLHQWTEMLDRFYTVPMWC